MAKQDFTSDLKKEAKKYKISVAQKAFADLLIMGYDKVDAYLLCGLFNPAISITATLHEIDILKEKKAFAAYFSERVEEINNQHREIQEVEEKAAIERSDEDYRSKDYIIDRLAMEAKVLKGKELVDTLMKIADLQQMKRDEVKEEDQRVHFYLPLNCFKCSHYKKYGTPRQTE